MEKVKEAPKVSVVLPILIREPWQKVMTEACIESMRVSTDIPFELIIVASAKTHSEYLKGLKADLMICEKEEDAWNSNQWLKLPEEADIYLKEFNYAAKQARGEFVVHVGNDVLMKPDWLGAMMQCFEIPDCGAATVASSDLQHVNMLKNFFNTDVIMEGVWCPLMMFRNGWLFDEDFELCFIDTDLIMRIYEGGQRMYRNWKVTVSHLHRQTWPEKRPEERSPKEDEGKKLFIKKHRGIGGHLLIYRVLTEGWVI